MNDMSRAGKQTEETKRLIAVGMEPSNLVRYRKRQRRAATVAIIISAIALLVSASSAAWLVLKMVGP